MSWLFDNPIGNMYGPNFLFLYGCVIAVTLIASWWMVRSADQTADLYPRPLRSNPDPYEIAYLRGGENEVTRLAIFDLIQRGYLKVSEDQKWWGGKDQRLAMASNPPDPRHLTPLEEKVFRFFPSSRTAADVLESGSLPADLKGLCADYESKLQNEKVLCRPEVSEAAKRIGRNAALIILGLGGYKLIAAIMTGHFNVIFLVFLGIGSLVGLAYVCRPQRLSLLGQDYLKRMQGSFERLKPNAGATDAGLTDTTLLLLVSLFGVDVLTGTSYAYFSQMFRRSSGGYGLWDGAYGGCGGGCGGGSGCGGGGCGGGGCGGCGGG